MSFWTRPVVRALSAAAVISVILHVIVYFIFVDFTWIEGLTVLAVAVLTATLCLLYWRNLLLCCARRVARVQLCKLGFVGGLVIVAYACVYATLWKYEALLFGGPTLHVHRSLVAVDMLYFSATNILDPGLGDVYGAVTLVRVIITSQSIATLVFRVFAVTKAMEYAGERCGRPPEIGQCGMWDVCVSRWFTWGALVAAFVYVLMYIPVIDCGVVGEIGALLLVAFLITVQLCGYVRRLCLLPANKATQCPAFHLSRLAAIFFLVALEFCFVYSTLYKYVPALFGVADPGLAPSPWNVLVDMIYFSVTNMSGPGLADIAPASATVRVVMIVQMVQAAILLVFAAAKVGDYIGCKPEGNKNPPVGVQVAMFP